MFGGLPGSKQKIGQSFPRGTTLLFWQAAAPIGWTRIVTQNDKLLRVVNANGGPLGGGGTNAFSVVNAQTVVGNTTLTTAQIPPHTHPISDPGHSHSSNAQLQNANFGVGGGSSGSPQPLTATINSSTTGITVQNNTGGGGSHNHTITMSIQFIDVILASKN
jgi:microcystin-dependent protein